MARPGDALLAGHVAEGAVSLVVIQPAGRVQVRYEEVEPAVTVEVAPGRTLGHAFIDDASLGGDVLERAVALVVVEPAAVGGIGRVTVVLAADEQVETAVVVVIAPDGRFGRKRLAEAAGDGHVLELASPLVA